MTPQKRSKKHLWHVLIAIALAIAFGSSVGETGGIGHITFYSIVDVFGKIFLNALKLVVVPLVSSSIIIGVAKIGKEGSFGRLGVKTFAFYLSTTLLAILTGLFFVNLIHPGSPEVLSASGQGASQLSALQQKLSSQTDQTILNVVLQIVPSNVLHAFSQGQMLGLIFFCLLFGYAISKIAPQNAAILHGFFEGIFQAMLRITHIIMRFLPYGVFCLIAKVFMTSGFSSIKSLALFSLAILLGLFTFMFIALPLLLKFIGKVKPTRHFRAMAPALITAFSTSSSSATLPITIDCVEKRAGVSNRICSLVVPLGTSINMSGSALYECVAALFVAQAYGLEISFATQFLVVFLSLITSIGVAGIPSGSLVALLIILPVLGLPQEGISLFLAVDRLLDMCRTTVNVFSDSVCAVLVAKSEGETEVLTKDWDEEFNA